jgi:hypothetical protein
MSTDNFVFQHSNMLERMGNNMKTVILLLVLSVLATGYSVASKASDTVNSIKQQQSMQLAAISRQ